MRRFSLFTLLVMIAGYAVAANAPQPKPRNDYRELITRYDVDDEVKNLPAGSPAEFWAKAIATNEWVTEFRINMAKMKSAEKATLERIDELPRIDEADSALIMPGWRSFCDSFIADMGIVAEGDSVAPISMLVVESDEALSFTALTRNGGAAVCLTEPLMLSVSADSLLLKSIVARELASLMLCQLPRRVYADTRGTRPGLPMLFFSVSSPGMGAMPLVIPLGIFKSKKKKKNEDPLVKYFLGYSREQELEAELLAYRFMEYIGAADAYCESLSFMGPDFDKLIDKRDYERAKEWSRTDFLKYVSTHSDISNSTFAEMKQKRLEKAAKEEAKRRKKAEKAALNE